MSKISPDIRVKLIESIFDAISALSLKDDKALERIFHRSRVRRDDAYRVLDEYGVDFGPPPPNAYEDIEISKAPHSENRYRTDVYLWNKGGTATDLSTILVINLHDGIADVRLEDLRVM